MAGMGAAGLFVAVFPDFRVLGGIAGASGSGSRLTLPDGSSGGYGRSPPFL